MARIALQDILAVTPAGGTVDLKAGEYTDNLNPEARQGIKITKKITIVGEGAKLFISPSARRDRPGIVSTVNATGFKLLGDVDVIFPDVARRDDLEAQHGIRMDGTQGAVVNGWQFQNMQGNGYYLGSDPETGLPCRTITLGEPKSINAGRAHFGINAIVGLHVIQPFMDTCGQGHSSIVYEPNGQHDICQDVIIEGGYYRGNTGFCFSAAGLKKGLKDYQFARVTLRQMTTKGSFGMTFGHGTERRGPFTGEDLTGHTVANKPLVHATGFDGLTIIRYSQPMSGNISPFDIKPDCTKVVTSLA